MESREQALALLAAPVGAGASIFQVAAQALALGVGCRWAGVAVRPLGSDQVRVIALWDRQGPAEGFEFDLVGSPCAEVYKNQEAHIFFPRRVIQRFPGFQLLRQLGVESYRGELFHNSEGHAVGHVFALGEGEAEDDPEIRSFFRLVAQRVGAEHNRLKAERRSQIGQQMLDTTTDGMAFIDEDGVYRAINSAFFDVLTTRPHPERRPWRRDDILGHSLREVLGETYFERRVRGPFERCLAGQRLEIQYWTEEPHSTRSFLKVGYTPCLDAEGRVIGIVGTVRDLTRRQRDLRTLAKLATDPEFISGDLERSIRRLTEVAASTLDVARASLWILEDGTRETADRAWLECIDLYESASATHQGGLRMEISPQSSFLRALAEHRAIDADDAATDPRTQELVEAYLAPHRITSLLDSPIRVGGRLAGVLCLEHRGPQRLWQASETTFAAAVSDLATQALLLRDRRKLEDDLHQARQLESLGVLAGGIAHDFNNLLVGVLGGAEIALEHLDDAQRIRPHLVTIRQSALRASELCSQMLAYAGKGRFQLEATDLAKVAGSIVEVIRPTLPPGIDLVFERGSNLPAVQMDVTQIRQIVLNLLTNAVESLDGHSGRVRLRVKRREMDSRDLALFSHKALEPKTYVLLEVEDNGCGMDEATRDRIFEPFFTTKLTGRGLGLAATLGVVQNHGGGIAIHSRPGHGTSIHLAFPPTDAPSTFDVTEDDSEPRPITTDSTDHKISILVVDDEEIVRLVAEGALESQGYEVLTAPDGATGLQHFESPDHGIDLVVLDLTMPGLSGEETLAEIRRRDTEIPVVIISGYSAEDTTHRFNELEISDFVAQTLPGQGSSTGRGAGAPRWGLVDFVVSPDSNQEDVFLSPILTRDKIEEDAEIELNGTRPGPG